MRQLIIASRLGRTEYQLLLMKISWWDRNVKIRYKCLVVIDEFLTVSLYHPNEFISWHQNSYCTCYLKCNLSAHVYCGQTAAQIKMPLGMEVGLGPGHIMLDGDPDPPPPKKGAQLPISGPCLLCPNGWMDQDTTWYGGRPPPKRHCVRWVPIYPLSKKGA